MYFEYGDKEIEYLKNRDAKLAEAIDRIGHINRPVHTDLFSCVVDDIVGQQISTAAQKTIWKRVVDQLGEVTPSTVSALSVEQIQSWGVSFRKAEYIKDFADKVMNGEFIIEELVDLPDEEVIERLSSLKGIGRWTAEMLMTFCMQRPDVVSYGDLAIIRGMRMLYHHRKIDKKLFEKYRRRYSPYGSVASLYLWAIAGGAIPEWKDYAPKKKLEKKTAEKGSAKSAKASGKSVKKADKTE